MSLLYPNVKSKHLLVERVPIASSNSSNHDDGEEGNSQGNVFELRSSISAVRYDFKYQAKDGFMEESTYAIPLARLAGFPESILQDAAAITRSLMTNHAIGVSGEHAVSADDAASSKSSAHRKPVDSNGKKSMEMERIKKRIMALRFSSLNDSALTVLVNDIYAECLQAMD